MIKLVGKDSDPISGDDYVGLCFFLNHENYGKEPLIIIIVHHEIIKIIVQNISDPITGDDYDTQGYRCRL
jgi:hypothetical protein